MPCGGMGGGMSSRLGGIFGCAAITEGGLFCWVGGGGGGVIGLVPRFTELDLYLGLALEEAPCLLLVAPPSAWR